MARTLTATELAGYASRADEAQTFAESMRAQLLAAMQGSSTPSDREISAIFNRKGLRTRTSERWSTSAVSNLRIRLGILKPARVSAGVRTRVV